MSEPAVGTAKSPARKFRLSLLAFLFILALLAWWLMLAPRPKFYLTTCLQDAGGLKQGAAVKIAGVDVGYVRRLRAQPQDASCPGIVEMAFTANYKLEIPRDSVVSTATAGLLGETYVEIDSTHASGPPVQNGDKLPSRQIQQPSLDDVVQALHRLFPNLKVTSQMLRDMDKCLEAQENKLPAKGIGPKQKLEK